MTGRPKLLHIFPTFDFGGMELRVITIMNALGERACHTVLPLDGRYEAAVRVKPPAALRIVPPPSGKGGLFYAMALRSVVSDIRPDLVLTYNWGAMDAVVGVGFKPLCPVIHNECGFGAEESEKLRFRRVVARRIALNRIFRTVVVSRSMLTVAREQFKVRPDKLRFIQTGVDVEGFQPGRHGTWRERRSIKPEEIVVGFVGGLRPEKNLGLLLRAYAASDLRNARLALIGDGPCRAELEDLAEKLGIRGKTIFEGRVTDVRESLAGMDVFVMSSATEQTPNALLEAMACGLPALATNVGDTAQILATADRPVVVPPNDLDAYQAALKAIVEDRELRIRLGDQNRRRVVDEYSFARMIRDYEALYLEAIAGHGQHDSNP